MKASNPVLTTAFYNPMKTETIILDASVTLTLTPKQAALIMLLAGRTTDVHLYSVYQQLSFISEHLPCFDDCNVTFNQATKSITFNDVE